MLFLLKIRDSSSRLKFAIETCKGINHNSKIQKSLVATFKIFSTRNLATTKSKNGPNIYFQLRNFSNKSPQFKDLEKAYAPKLSGIPKKNRKSRIDNFFEWIVSLQGRKVFGNSIAACACLAFIFGIGIELAMPWRLLRSYAEIDKEKDVDSTELYESNFEADQVAPPEELVMLMSKLGGRAQLDEIDHMRTSVFVSRLMNPLTIGTTGRINGASHGFPRHMMWRTKDEVDLGSVYFKTNWNPLFQGYKVPEDANPDKVEKLKESLVLSPGAREFIVSYMMNKASLGYPTYACGILPAVAIFYNYYIGSTMNKRFNLFEMPRWFRLGIQAFCFSTTIITFTILWNEIKGLAHVWAIDAVVRTEEEVEYAKEYYQKCLERNKILRDILGENSHYHIREDGEIEPNFYEIIEAEGYGASFKYLDEVKQKLKEKNQE